MDPNETLRQILNLAPVILAADFATDDDTIAAGHELAGLVMDLHAWIIKGGFLPDRWEVAQKRAKQNDV